MIKTVYPYMAFADDSGKKESEIVVVGGWIAGAVEWEAFETAWSRLIGPTGLSEFKRSGFQVRKYGEEFLLELSALVHRSLSYGFACGVDTDGWRAVANDYALELFHLVPYSICARTCIGFVREWGADRKIRTDHIGYMFDRGSDGAGEFTELLKIDQSQDARDTVARISSGDSIEFAGLQAADYLSWGVRSQFMAAGPDQDKWDMDDVSREILALLGAPFVYRIPKFGIYYAESLAKLCRDAKIPLKKDVPPEMWSGKRPIRFKFPATKP